MRIKHKIWVNIAKDADMEYLQFAPGEAQVSAQIDGYTKQSNSDFKVLKTANEDLSLGDVAAVKGMYLEVSADCILKLNGGSEEIQLRRGNSSASDVAKFFAEMDITQINITAPADVDITGNYAVWGDASA